MAADQKAYATGLEPATTVTDTKPARSERSRPPAEPVSDGRPVLESRRRRLSAYLRYNWERICRDAIVLGSWALLLTVGFRTAGLPPWMCYTVTFVGVVGYTRLTSTWSRPYTSPDEVESEAGSDGRRSEKPEQRHE